MKKLIRPIHFVLLTLIVLVINNCKNENDIITNHSPTCKINSPLNGQELIKGHVIKLEFGAADNNGYILKVRFFVDDIENEAVIGKYHVFYWPTEGEAFGNHNLKITVTDNDGEQNTDEITIMLVKGIGGKGEPCPGEEIVMYGGQVYNTVQIGEQCWFHENLNYDSGNSWCYNNDTSNCNIYGRLYDWATALGVCPPGWHLATENDWNNLEGEMDSFFNVGDPEWEDFGFRGFDVSTNIKSATGWNNNGNGTDINNFSLLPIGLKTVSGEFSRLGDLGYYWTSKEKSSELAYFRYFDYYHEESSRAYFDKNNGYGVRCVQNE
jgi:uncharacterized protein (TIGR02145 family)